MNPYFDSAEDVAKWRRDRGTKLGASDSAAILGLSPWKTPLQVYAEKCACIDNGPTDEPAAVEKFNPESPLTWGHLHEPAIARAYELDRDVKLIRPAAATHGVFTFVGASADRAVIDNSRLVELKTANLMKQTEWGEVGTDDIPQQYLIQVQHQMSVYRIPVADVAVLFGGTDFRVYTVHFSDVIEHYILDALDQFWGFIERREPPDPDWSHPSTPDVVRRLRDVREGSVALLDGDEYGHLCRQHEKWSAVESRAEKEKKLIAAKLAFAMGEAERAVVNQYRITRSKAVVPAYTVKESVRCQIRVTKQKGR